MQLADTRIIKASPSVVWDAILNPEVLKQCVPGCESMTGSVEEGFEATVKQKIGPVSATFGGMVNYADSIRSRILNSPIKTIVYIDNNAASAGALIAIACDKIYMRKGAGIGALAFADP